MASKTSFFLCLWLNSFSADSSTSTILFSTLSSVFYLLYTYMNIFHQFLLFNLYYFLSNKQPYEQMRWEYYPCCISIMCCLVMIKLLVHLKISSYITALWITAPYTRYIRLHTKYVHVSYPCDMWHVCVYICGMG